MVISVFDRVSMIPQAGIGDSEKIAHTKRLGPLVSSPSPKFQTRGRGSFRKSSRLKKSTYACSTSA